MKVKMFQSYRIEEVEQMVSEWLGLKENQSITIKYVNNGQSVHGYDNNSTYHSVWIFYEPYRRKQSTGPR